LATKAKSVPAAVPQPSCSRKTRCGGSQRISPSCQSCCGSHRALAKPAGGKGVQKEARA